MMANLKEINEIPNDNKYYKLGYKTFGTRDDDNWSVKHYDTVIIKCVDGIMTLDGGGYRSEATLERMNFYLNANGTFVHEHEGLWQVTLASGGSAMFDDGIRVGGFLGFDLYGCVHDIEIVRKRDQLLKYLNSEVKIFDVIPDKYVFDICRALNYPNIPLAVESLDHKVILEAFKKLCFTRLPDVKDIVMK